MVPTSKNPQGEVSDYYKGARKEMLRFIPSGCGTLLDVGCGAGAFGALVKQTFGAQVWGVDPSFSVSTVAPQVIDHFVKDFFSDKLGLPQNFFDVITFNDSLEHFPDPLPPLEVCRSLLKSGGVIIASIPNVRYIENVKHFLVEMDWKYEDKGIRDRTHLRFFTKQSIMRTFEEAGYDIVLMEGINRRYWWWEGKRFFPVRLILGKWILDMNYLEFAVIAKVKVKR